MPFLLPAAAVAAVDVGAGTVAATTAAAAAGTATAGTLAAASVAGASAAGTGLSLSSLVTAATIGSTAISALGSIQQSRAAAASAGYNAKVAAQNAEIQTQNANFAGAAGQQEVGAQGAKTKAAIGATLAAQGASGVDVNTGSSVDVRESEAKLGTLNSLTIRSNAVKQAYGYQIGAASNIGQSQLLKKQKENDITGGYVDAGATVLGGVGKASLYSDWLNNGGL